MLVAFWLGSVRYTRYSVESSASYRVHTAMKRSWKVMEIRKICLDHGKVVEFFPQIVLTDGQKVKNFRQICVKHQNVQPVRSNSCQF